MKKTLTILALFMTLFFAGCNNDTHIYNVNDKNITDNSKLADAENQYGYFGEYVKFGGQYNLLTLSPMRIYAVQDGNAYDSAIITFSADGSGLYDANDDGNNILHDYGVSKDSNIISTSFGGEIEYLETRKKVYGTDNNGNDITDECLILSFPQRFGNKKVEYCCTIYVDANGNVLNECHN